MKDSVTIMPKLSVLDHLRRLLVLCFCCNKHVSVPTFNVQSREIQELREETEEILR